MNNTIFKVFSGQRDLIAMNNEHAKVWAKYALKLSSLINISNVCRWILWKDNILMSPHWITQIHRFSSWTVFRNSSENRFWWNNRKFNWVFGKVLYGMHIIDFLWIITALTAPTATGYRGHGDITALRGCALNKSSRNLVSQFGRLRFGIVASQPTRLTTTPNSPWNVEYTFCMLIIIIPWRGNAGGTIICNSFQRKTLYRARQRRIIFHSAGTAVCED